VSALDLRIEVGRPLVRGALALYPLFADAAPAPVYLPGPLAAAAGTLRVNERESGPEVPELSVANAGPLPLLLVEGETLLGGWQDRTLNVSIILAAGATAAVPVSCVERGRWGGAYDGARPAPALAPTALRARKQRSVAASVLGGSIGRQADQGDVWRAVDEYADRFAADAPTAALGDVQRARQGDLDAAVVGARPLPGQRGVAVAVGDSLRSVDLFDRPDTLEPYWESLVRGHALDAVDCQPESPPGHQSVVEAFERLRRARTRTVDGVGLGEEIHAQAEGLSAGALVWEGAVVHLALFLHDAPGGGGRRRWFAPA
jgi:hypothetical protein